LSHGRRVLLLDRDGVINFDSDAYIKSAAEWRPIPGSLEAIARFSSAGYEVFIVSNQSGLARGLFDETALTEIHERMRTSIEAQGGRVDGIYYCPHGPEDGCDCRKPKPGLLRRIEREHGLRLAGQLFVGDKCSDVQAALAVGAIPILVRTGQGEASLRACKEPIPSSYEDLAAVADAILGEERK